MHDTVTDAMENGYHGTWIYHGYGGYRHHGSWIPWGMDAGTVGHGYLGTLGTVGHGYRGTWIPLDMDPIGHGSHWT